MNSGSACTALTEQAPASLLKSEPKPGKMSSKPCQFQWAACVSIRPSPCRSDCHKDLFQLVCQRAEGQTQSSGRSITARVTPGLATSPLLGFPASPLPGHASPSFLFIQPSPVPLPPRLSPPRGLWLFLGILHSPWHGVKVRRCWASKRRNVPKRPERDDMVGVPERQ